MNKAIFLDRDGTINVEKEYLYKVDDFQFIPGVLEGLKLLQDSGFKLITITNQSGIARGYYSESEYHILTDWMLDMLKKQGIYIDKVYYCPHHPYAFNINHRVNCDCRKPKLGLFKRAIKEFDIDLAQSYSIGDRIRDCSICETTLCKGFLIGQGEEKGTIQSVKSGGIVRVEYADDILSCAKKIVVK